MTSDADIVKRLRLVADAGFAATSTGGVSTKIVDPRLLIEAADAIERLIQRAGIAETERQAIKADAFREAAGVTREHERKRAEYAADLLRSDAARHTNAVVAGVARDIARTIENLATPPSSPPETEKTI